MTTDNSVTMALAELEDIERQRLREEQDAQAREAKRRADAAARAQADAAAQARVRAEERAEALVRLELEVAARAEAEARKDGSLDALRTQLSQVVAEREAMQRALVARLEGQGQAPARSRWASALGIASLAASALAGGLLMVVVGARDGRVERPPTEVRRGAAVTDREALVAPSDRAPRAASGATSAVSPSGVLEARSVAVTAPIEPDVRPRDAQGPRAPRESRDAVGVRAPRGGGGTDAHADLGAALGLEEGGDDPLEGASALDSESRPRRGR